MKKIYVFGSLNMDLVINSPREVLQGETIQGSGFMTNPGGKGANQAVACGKLGGKVFMGGAVGSDGFGTELTNNLSACGVDVSRVRKLPGVPTGVAVILIVNHDNRIILDAGANGLADESDVDRLLADAGPGDILLTQLENRIEIIGYALQKAKALGMTTILNPAPMNLAIMPYLPYADIITPNETELALMAGSEEQDLNRNAEALFNKGVSVLVITLGGKGYAYRQKTDASFYYGKAIPVEVVDTTAAGDTFCGALAVRLAEDRPLDEALAFANKAASVTVTRKGAQQAIPTIDEL